MQNTAVIFGATGLTGGFVLGHLLDSEHFREVISFSRTQPEREHPRLKKRLFPPSESSQILSDSKVDMVFCCLGNTRKKAGSKAAFKAVDYDLVMNIARSTVQAGIPTFAVISSVGANERSRNFYLRVKGEMERDLMKAGFKNLLIFRPSLLMGLRSEYRFGEEIAKWLSKKIPWIYSGKLRKYAPVHAADLAAAMVKAALERKGTHIIESTQI